MVQLLNEGKDFELDGKKYKPENPPILTGRGLDEGLTKLVGLRAGYSLALVGDKVLAEITKASQTRGRFATTPSGAYRG